MCTYVCVRSTCRRQKRTIWMLWSSLSYRSMSLNRVTLGLVCCVLHSLILPFPLSPYFILTLSHTLSPSFIYTQIFTLTFSYIFLPLLSYHLFSSLPSTSFHLSYRCMSPFSLTLSSAPLFLFRGAITQYMYNHIEDEMR